MDGKTVFGAVEAFMEEHHGCGDVSAGVTEPGPAGYHVRLACACGARLAQIVTVKAAEMTCATPGC